MITHKEVAEALFKALISAPYYSVSRHIDEVAGLEKFMPSENLWFLEVFAELSKLVRDVGNKRHIITTVSFNETDFINCESLLKRLDYPMDVSSVTYYLLSGNDVFIPAHEEYKIEDVLPEKFSGIKAVSRSFKTLLGVENGWPYENCLYVYWDRGHADGYEVH